MYDFAIIGAGIAGAGVAAMLPSSCTAILLEKEDTPGYHATGRSAAIFVQNYGSPVIRELTKASRALLEEPPEDFSKRGFLSPRGVMLVSSLEDQALLEKELTEGEGMAKLSPQEAARIVPLLNPERISGAAYEEDAQDIDVAALHQAYLKQAKSKNVDLVCNAVLHKASRENECWVIETGTGEIRAKTVINAAGAWVDEVASIFGIEKIGFCPLRRSMAVLPAPSCGGHENWPMVADVAETWYMKPDAGHLYVSPADETPVEPHDAYVDDLILAEGLYAFE
ncbi:MAG: FAD-binding oxidoreductase, partial [Sneathiellales bacterium]|nr:FAD-binding oxidoreductase [Sneathiellales bacterium]